MYPEIEQFKDWLTCQSPTSSTRIHYTSDLVLFFSWAGKPPCEIIFEDFVGLLDEPLTKVTSYCFSSQRT